MREEEQQIFPAFHWKIDPKQNGKLSGVMHLQGEKTA